MKYTITINQLAVVETELDIIDVAILEFIKDYCSSIHQGIEQQRITNDNGIWTWINYETILKGLPILRFKSKNALVRYIKRLEQWGYIKTFREKNIKQYFQITLKAEKIFIKTEPVTEQLRPVTKRLQVLSPNGDRAVTKSIQYYNTIDNNTKDNIIANKSQSTTQEVKPVKKYERKPVDKQTQLQRICYFLEDTLKMSIVNWGKQAKALSMMLKAGYTEKQVLYAIRVMAEDEFYEDKGFDLMTVANNIAQIKAQARKAVRYNAEKTN